MLVIVGLGGDLENANRFHQWASTIVDAARGRYGSPPRASCTSARTRPATRSAISGRSTREAIAAAVDAPGRAARPGDRVLIVLIGHGASATGGARFNLPGPDLTAADYRVTPRPTRGADGGLRQHRERERRLRAALSGRNRVVIAATTSDGERNQTRFGEFFAEAFTADGADGDKDGRVSMLEAFNWARTRVADSYKRDGQLLTEHAVLDDNGDGKGTAAPGQPGADGALARTLFLSAASAPRAIADQADPELRALVAQRDALEARVADPQGGEGQDRSRDIRARPRAVVDRSGPGESGHSGEAEVMKTAVIGLAVLVVAATVVVVASQQVPPVRLPAVPFGAAGGSPPQRPGGGMPPGAFGQGRGGMRSGQLDRSEANDLSPGQLPYDGHFVFARLRYDQGVSPDELGGGRFFGRRGRGGQGPPWSHDYPRAERNFMKILSEITTIDPYTGPLGGIIVDIGSPDLFKYPVRTWRRRASGRRPTKRRRTCAPTCSRAAS